LQGRIIAAGAALQAFAYALLIPAFPFPVFPVLYAVAGFGMAIQDSMGEFFPFRNHDLAEPNLSL